MDKFCKFTKFYEEPQKKYNVYTTVLFFTPYAYKDSMKYIKGLRRNLKDFYIHFDNNFYFRVYFDRSAIEKIHDNDELNKITEICKQHIEELKTAPRVQMIMFDCPKFKKNEYHKGLFGTLLRFNPLFGEENVNVVMSSDIEELAIYDVKIIYEYFQLHNVDIGWRTGVHNSIDQKNERIVHDDWIYAGNFVSRVKFNSDVLYKFFSDLEIDDSNLNKYLSEVRKFLGDHPENRYKKIIDNNKYFIYGHDEALLNFYLKPLFEKNNNSVIIFHLPRLTTIFSLHFRENNRFNNLTDIEKEDINIFYKLAFGNLIKFSKNPVENFYLINKLSMPIRYKTYKFFEINFLKNYKEILKKYKEFKISENVLNNIKLSFKKLHFNEIISKYKYKYKKW